MQLIDRAEVVDAEVVDVDPAAGQRGEDPGLQVLTAVVLSDQICDVHLYPRCELSRERTLRRCGDRHIRPGESVRRQTFGAYGLSSRPCSSR